MGAKRQKYMSTYEEDLIWMSARYCIGRHTISASMHAGNIAKNAYGKLKPARQEFEAFDIRRCIEDDLRFSSLNLYVDSAICNNRSLYDPMKFLYEAILQENITKTDELKKISSINVELTRNGTYSIRVEYRKDDSMGGTLPSLMDLLAWNDLAALFYTPGHMMVTASDGKDNKETLECFPSLILYNYSDGTFEMKQVWKPVEEYVKAPFVDRYIPSEYIVNIEKVN